MLVALSDTQGHLGTQLTVLQVSPHLLPTERPKADLMNPDLYRGSLRYGKVK